MISFVKQLEEKIKKEFNPERIQLINNSHLHARHKSFDSSKFHLKLIIKSVKLKKMNRVDSHKIIYSILQEEIKDKIHALEIEIE